MDTMERHQPHTDNFVSVAIELTNRSSSSLGAEHEVGSIQTIELADNAGIRLVVVLPNQLDEESANLAAAQLLEQIDRLSDRNICVDRVNICGLQFSPESVIPITGFLSAHSRTIRHVTLKEIIPGGENPKVEDVGAFNAISQVFQRSKSIETLNLSDNNLQMGQLKDQVSLWKDWSVHTNLRQFILDSVVIDDASLEELASNFTFCDSLEELHVVLTRNVGPWGLEAANRILKSCSKLSTLQWTVRDAALDSKLPWYGLAQMAESRDKSKGQSTLMHLIMEGGTISGNETRDLYTALKYLSRLQTLKLKSIGLTDEGTVKVARSLLHAKPSLESLDLSRNKIRTNGAASIARFCEEAGMVKKLGVLVLECNNIDEDGACYILEALGGIKGRRVKVEIRMEGNPFDYGNVAMRLARQKIQAEQQRYDLMQEIALIKSQMSELSTGKSTTSSSSSLQHEIQRLREEKETLMRAFSIMGTSKQMESHVNLMERVATLEKMLSGVERDRHDSNMNESFQTRASFQRRRSSLSSEGSQKFNSFIEPVSILHLGESTSLSLHDTPNHQTTTPRQSIDARHFSSSSSHSLQNHHLQQYHSPSPGRSMKTNMREMTPTSLLQLTIPKNSFIKAGSERWNTNPKQRRASLHIGGSSINSALMRNSTPCRYKDDGDALSIKTSQTMASLRSFGSD